MKEAHKLALRYNKVVIEHNNYMDRAKFLQVENDKLAKVIPCTTLLSRIFIFLLNFAHFDLQMLVLEENKVRQQEVEISGLTRRKNEADEAIRRMELAMNRALYQAKH